VCDLVIVAAAYLLGCVQTGYYLVRLTSGQDLRLLGSGATGARNTGRVLGRRGFVLALLGDMGKGALAMALATRFSASPWAPTAALVAVTAGHVWPVQLRFTGGRGVAVGLGALAVCDLRLLGILAVVTGLGYVASRRFQASGLVGFAVIPLAAWYLHLPREALVGILCLSAVILFAHRRHIIHWFPRRPPCGASTRAVPSSEGREE
jgi:acyl phosphate:glycerol-3-phosphate acyltransferase